MLENNKNSGDISFKRRSRIEAFNQVQGCKVNDFLDRNGYTVREVRGIAHHAIALWETQKVQ